MRNLQQLGGGGSPTAWRRAGHRAVGQLGATWRVLPRVRKNPPRPHRAPRLHGGSARSAHLTRERERIVVVDSRLTKPEYPPPRKVPVRRRSPRRRVEGATRPRASLASSGRAARNSNAARLRVRPGGFVRAVVVAGSLQLRDARLIYPDHRLQTPLNLGGDAIVHWHVEPFEVDARHACSLPIGVEPIAPRGAIHSSSPSSSTLRPGRQ